MKIPDRWLNYTKCRRIDETPFVACKVPLREGYSTKLDSETRFTPRDFIAAYPKVKMVIDLTLTTAYYNGNKEFGKYNIKYVKIPCRGNNNLPSDLKFQTFVKTVQEFMQSNPEGNLIAVHCTHGVNRTGYFIVRYMIEVMGYDSETALKNFMMCRNHVIERERLIDDLFRRHGKRRHEIQE